MYTLTVFETAQELLDAFVQVREKDDNSPVVPQGAYVVFNGDHCVSLSGVEDLLFRVSEKITQSDVINELFTRAGIRVHIT